MLAKWPVEAVLERWLVVLSDRDGMSDIEGSAGPLVEAEIVPNPQMVSCLLFVICYL